jgi:hypothetical protein
VEEQHFDTFYAQSVRDSETQGIMGIERTSREMVNGERGTMAG